jgi:hypothetical protein
MITFIIVLRSWAKVLLRRCGQVLRLVRRELRVARLHLGEALVDQPQLLQRSSLRREHIKCSVVCGRPRPGANACVDGDGSVGA